MEDPTNSIWFSLNTVELWSSPWGDHRFKICPRKLIAYIHIGHKVVLLIGVDEERGNSKADEDKCADQGDHPHRHLLGYQGPADDGKAGAYEVTKDASDADAGNIIDT